MQVRDGASDIPAFCLVQQIERAIQVTLGLLYSRLATEKR